MNKFVRFLKIVGRELHELCVIFFNPKLACEAMNDSDDIEEYHEKMAKIK